uniref:VOC family protein n=1 Tax=Thermosporothrix sp. COM3 TaxID=2490863 RepID=A0A455SJF6_9CHLR|nr:VOC family protein [Thermosporothrix sp. COM3]
MEYPEQNFTPYLLFVGELCGRAEEAITFYMSLFKDSRLLNIERYEEEEMAGEKAGTVKLARFSLKGQEFLAQDSGQGHHFTFTPAMSLFVRCETEAEMDTLYQKLSEGGGVLMPADQYLPGERFGWVVDKYGVSWQLHMLIPTP